MTRSSTPSTLKQSLSSSRGQLLSLETSRQYKVQAEGTRTHSPAHNTPSRAAMDPGWSFPTRTTPSFPRRNTVPWNSSGH